MEFLSNIFGNLTSGIIRLAVTVGILAAVYFFIVKPVLHTTEHTVDSANKAFEKSFNGPPFDSPPVNTKAIEAKVNKTIENVNREVQVQVEHSFHVTKTRGGEKKQEKLLHCVQRANENVHRIERCAKRF
jgi:flagellar biosynthesis/type III secretory pathway M-ring protein FliF/YscJ